MSNGEKGFNHHVASMDSVPVTRKELEALEGAVVEMEKRMDRVDSAVPDIVKQAIAEVLAGRVLSPEEVVWTRLAIQREAQSIKLRQALIEKTLTSLIWAGIVGVGYLILDGLKSHGWRV